MHQPGTYQGFFFVGARFTLLVGPLMAHGLGQFSLNLRFLEQVVCGRNLVDDEGDGKSLFDQLHTKEGKRTCFEFFKKHSDPATASMDENEITCFLRELTNLNDFEILDVADIFGLPSFFFCSEFRQQLHRNHFLERILFNGRRLFIPSQPTNRQVSVCYNPSFLILKLQTWSSSLYPFEAPSY